MKPRTSSDSLDLLLDAMCNMLGGVIFLALFAALLLTLPAPEKERGAKPDSRSEAELAQSLAALRERAAFLRALRPETETEEEAGAERRLRDECAGAEAEYRTLLDRRRRRQAARERAARERQLREDFLALSPAERECELARLRDENLRLRREIAALPAKPWVFAPTTRSALQPWRLILADGRLYRLGDNAAVRRGGSAEVRAEGLRRNGQEYWMLRVEPGKGTPCADFPWEAWSETVPRERYFIELLVLPGDVAGAAAVREELRRLGFRQSWRVRNVENLALTARKGGVYEAGE